MCFCVGEGLLLQSAGAWLSDEERAGSFRNNQTEPTLDGEEPVHATRVAYKNPISTSETRAWGVSLRW